MMRLCCNTASFRQEYLVNRWDQARLFQAVAESKVDGVIVEERYFNERAMWWARIGRDTLRKSDVELVAIGTSIELSEKISDRIERQIANLMEWGRIAALSDIPFLCVDIRGPEVEHWSATQDALRQVVEYVCGYGTLLILSRIHQPDERKLLCLAKALGYRRCRIGLRNRSHMDPEIRPWVKELIVQGYEEVPADDQLLVCVDPVNTARAVQEIRDAVRKMRREG